MTSLRVPAVVASSILSLALIASCAPNVPDSGAPIVLDQPRERALARADRDAQLEGTTFPARPSAISSEALPPAGETPTATTEGATDDSIIVTGPAPEAVTSSGISAENDFERVGELRSIESDAERMERLREQYRVITPQAVPTRAGSEGPNIVQYALSTQNKPGEVIYSRLNLRGEAAYQRRCAEYPSADQAQVAFLSNGGPDRDRLGVDPDGDGFACDWDPTPFRRAVGGN